MSIGAEIRSRREANGMTQTALQYAVEAANLRQTNRPPAVLMNCPVESIERWESGKTIPTPHTLRALAYVLDANPSALIARWEKMRNEEYTARYSKASRKAPPAATPRPSLSPEQSTTPEPSGTIDLCITDGEETLRFEGADVEEAVRRFRDFLKGEVVPDGGRVVLISCVEYSRKETKGGN